MEFRKDIKSFEDIKVNKDYDALVYEYRAEETSDRRRGKILEIISKKYLPKVNKKSLGVPDRDKDDYYQVYMMRLIKAIEAWRGDSLFTTYLYGSAVRGVLQDFLIHNRKKEFRAKQIILVDDFDGLDIDAIQSEYADENWDIVKTVKNK